MIMFSGHRELGLEKADPAEQNARPMPIGYRLNIIGRGQGQSRKTKPQNGRK